jgi:hypothetical protein
VSLLLPSIFLHVFRFEPAGVFRVGGGAIWIAGLVLALAWDKGEIPLVQHLWRAQDKQECLLLCSGRFGWREEEARRIKAWLPKIYPGWVCNSRKEQALQATLPQDSGLQMPC